MSKRATDRAPGTTPTAPCGGSVWLSRLHQLPGRSRAFASTTSDEFQRDRRLEDLAEWLEVLKTVREDGALTVASRQVAVGLLHCYPSQAAIAAMPCGRRPFCGWEWALAGTEHLCRMLLIFESGAPSTQAKLQALLNPLPAPAPRPSLEGRGRAPGEVTVRGFKNDVNPESKL